MQGESHHAIIYTRRDSAEKIKNTNPLFVFGVNHHGDNPSISFGFIAFISLPKNNNHQPVSFIASVSLPSGDNPNSFVFLMMITSW